MGWRIRREGWRKGDIRHICRDCGEAPSCVANYVAAAAPPDARIISHSRAPPAIATGSAHHISSLMTRFCASRDISLIVLWRGAYYANATAVSGIGEAVSSASRQALARPKEHKGSTRPRLVPRV